MAKAAQAKYGFIRESGSGKSERFVNAQTGESISRRQYDKVRREAETGIKYSNESLSKENKRLQPIVAASRPARNKTSLKQLSQQTREDIARARIEKEAADKKAHDERVAQKKLERLTQQRLAKKVKPKKLNGRILRPGALGARVDFNDYEEYLALFEQGHKDRKKFFSYSLGVVGIDARDGYEKTPILSAFKRLDFDQPISEDDFIAETEDFVESKASYFLFRNWFMHVSFGTVYANTRKTKQKPRKRK